MGRGNWQDTAHGVAELDTTERLTHTHAHTHTHTHLTSWSSAAKFLHPWSPGSSIVGGQLALKSALG